jgi:hypothetical protein
MNSHPLLKTLCSIAYYLFSVPVYLLLQFVILAGAFDILTDSIWSVVDDVQLYGIVFLISFPMSVFISYYFRNLRKYHVGSMIIGGIAFIVLSFFSIKEYVQIDAVDNDMMNLVLSIFSVFSDVIILATLVFFTVVSLFVFLLGSFGILRLRYKVL